MNKYKQQKAASVHQLLLNKARQSGRPFNELLQYYAMERFLYRISQTDYVERFVLKGALLLRVTGISEIRFTRDIDFLALSKSTSEDIKYMLVDCCQIEIEEDGQNNAHFLYHRQVCRDTPRGVGVNTKRFLQSLLDTIFKKGN